MGFFDWVAPVFGRFGDRWSEARIEEIATLLRPHLGTRAAVLDLGGGTGALAVRLADALPATATVLDPTPAMVRYVPKDLPRVDVALGTAERMPFENGAFDVVVVSDAFHHFRDQDAAVREIARVTRCGGALFMTEYDRRGASVLLVAAERLVGEPAAFFAPDELCAFMRDRGVEGSCIPRRGITYDFFGVVTQGAPQPAKRP